MRFDMCREEFGDVGARVEVASAMGIEKQLGD